MEKRPFGTTGFEVTVLSFGGAAVSGEGGGYGFGEISEKDSNALLHGAFDRGINLFDTAPIYGFGLSEKRIGKAFKGSLRDKLHYVSKSGVTWSDQKRVNRTNDPQVTTEMLEQSLRDLETDYIDLYMIHWPDPQVDIRRPMEVLSQAKRAGKIRSIGLCNTTIDDLEKATQIESVDVVQSELNFFQNGIVENLFPYLRQHGQGFMSWGTLDKGILTGRVHRDRKYDSSDARSWAPWWKDMDIETKFQKMDRVNTVLKKHTHSGLELALGFNLQFPEVSTLLCGTRSLEQIDSLMLALNNIPKADVLKEAIEASEG